MEYTPRYPQPFTLWQAVQLDVPIITEEIARLQNSLVHLRSTQDSLQEAIEETHDADFVQAMEENAGVIGSQEERISILRMALSQKGVPISAHCANGSHPPPTPEHQLGAEQLEQEHPAQIVTIGHVAATVQHADSHVDDDGGIDL